MCAYPRIHAFLFLSSGGAGDGGRERRGGGPGGKILLLSPLKQETDVAAFVLGQSVARFRFVEVFSSLPFPSLLSFFFFFPSSPPARPLPFPFFLVSSSGCLPCVSSCRGLYAHGALNVHPSRRLQTRPYERNSAFLFFSCSQMPDFCFFFPFFFSTATGDVHRHHVKRKDVCGYEECPGGKLPHTARPTAMPACRAPPLPVPPSCPSSALSSLGSIHLLARLAP